MGSAAIIPLTACGQQHPDGGKRDDDSHNRADDPGPFVALCPCDRSAVGGVPPSVGGCESDVGLAFGFHGVLLSRCPAGVPCQYSCKRCANPKTPHFGGCTRTQWGSAPDVVTICGCSTDNLCRVVTIIGMDTGPTRDVSILGEGRDSVEGLESGRRGPGECACRGADLAQPTTISRTPTPRLRSDATPDSRLSNVNPFTIGGNFSRTFSAIC